MEAEYHLIDLATGLADFGRWNLRARTPAMKPLLLVAWDIFHGNVHVERHGPRTDRIC